nr:MAG TPA: hypothetical protein [Caudoviricetes sp.]
MSKTSYMLKTIESFNTPVLNVVYTFLCILHRIV